MITTPIITPPDHTTGSNILVALDESTHSVNALTWCFDYLVKSPEDKITVVSVIASEAEREATTSRLKTLLRAVYQANTVEVKLSVRVLVGFGSQIGPLLCALVDEVKPAMLVLGSAGKSHLEGFMVGSVSQYCIAHASCPVIVSRLTVNEERGREKIVSGAVRRRSKSPFFG
ncbi:hypothetical protein HDU76_011808 [Blyttiomyces sp. JEL0837]|nr:hypothetical protein HDU76_011808 [Blyttiomyces sp. JEL0837]